MRIYPQVWAKRHVKDLALSTLSKKMKAHNRALLIILMLT